MSIAQSYAAVSNADTASRQQTLAEQQDARKARSDELTQQAMQWQNEQNQLKGSTTASEVDLKLQSLEATSQALAAQNSELIAHKNSSDITTILSNITAGNWEDAKNTWNGNNLLKDAISKTQTLNMKDINPVNFNDPSQLKQLQELGLQSAHLTPEVQQALSKSVVAIVGQDDKTRVVPVQRIIDQTNTYNMMSKNQKDELIKNARQVNSILSGVGQTSTEQKTQETAGAIQSNVAEQTLKALQEHISSGKATPESISAIMAPVTAKDKLAATTSIEEAKIRAFASMQGDGKRDSLQQAVEVFNNAYPNATPAEKQKFYQELSTVKLEGVGGNRQKREIDEISLKQVQNQDMFTSGQYDPKVARENENAILAQSPVKTSIVKDIATMKSGFDTAITIDRILSGPAEKLKAGAIDTTKTWVESKLGTESAQAFDNIDFNTRAGMVLSNFMKEMSGTAVSEGEMSRLNSLLLGGNLSDEAYVVKALKTFGDELKSKNKELATTLGVNAPYSAKTYSTFNEPASSKTKSLADIFGAK